jgi:hypothetical protein
MSRKDARAQRKHLAHDYRDVGVRATQERLPRDAENAKIRRAIAAFGEMITILLHLQSQPDNHAGYLYYGIHRIAFLNRTHAGFPLVWNEGE